MEPQGISLTTYCYVSITSYVVLWFLLNDLRKSTRQRLRRGAPKVYKKTNTKKLERMQKELPKMKKKLNALVKKGDHSKIMELCINHLKFFRETVFPDQWSDWTRAYMDAQWRSGNGTSRPLDEQ